MMDLRREHEDHEFGASFDDVRERFSGEFSRCWRCGMLTVDAAGHCEDRDRDPDEWEIDARMAEQDGDEGLPELPNSGRQFRPFPAPPGGPALDEECPF